MQLLQEIERSVVVLFPFLIKSVNDSSTFLAVNFIWSNFHSCRSNDDDHLTDYKIEEHIGMMFLSLMHMFEETRKKRRYVLAYLRYIVKCISVKKIQKCISFRITPFLNSSQGSDQHQGQACVHVTQMNIHFENNNDDNIDDDDVDDDDE